MLADHGARPQQFFSPRSFAAACALLAAAFVLGWLAGRQDAPLRPTCDSTSRARPPAAAGSGAGPFVYLLANNPNANETWRRVRVGPQDYVVMFNWCTPLPAFQHVPQRQMLVMFRQNARFPRLTKWAKVFSKVVFLETALAHTLARGNASWAPLKAVRDFEALESGSSFLGELYEAYNRTEYWNAKRGLTGRMIPSSGYMGFRYCQRFMPNHTPVLVGFSSTGASNHNWEFEARAFDDAGVLRL